MDSSTRENSLFHFGKTKWNTSGTVDCPRKNAKCSTVPAVPPIIEKPASVLSKSPDEEWAEYDARSNASKTIYPGDWIRLCPDESYPHWRSAREQAANNDCEVCGESLAAEPYLWCHRTSQVARCPDCQETEWWADGYEIDEFGNPSCWDSNHTREERIAERERHCGSKAGVWLPVPGRAGLAT